MESQNVIDQYKKVLALTSQINSTLDLDELLTTIMNTSTEVMRSEVASLMLLDETTNELVFRVALGDMGSKLKEQFRVKMGEGISGTVAETGESLIVNDVMNDPRFAKRFDKSTGFITKAIICVPLKIKGKVIGVLQAINPIGRDDFSESDLNLFEIFADQSALAVENAKLHSEILKQAQMKQTIEIANQIQQNFLKKFDGTEFTIDVAAKNIQALGIGGDFYDAIKLNDHLTHVIIGDVSGKGIPAALYMIKALSEYRFLASQIDNVSELITKLNNRICKQSAFGMFMTITCLLFDSKNNTLTYGSAGHHPTYHFKGDSASSIFLSEATGIPAGLDPSATFEEHSTSYNKGDYFLLYTDGISEARNMSKTEYGTEHFDKILKNLPVSSQDFMEMVLADVQQFAAGAPQHDDMTLVSIKA